MLRVTLPALRQLVQTFRRFGAPLTRARIRWIFGFQRRLVRTCECETCLPKPGPLPQTSHTEATVISFARQLDACCVRKNATYKLYMTTIGETKASCQWYCARRTPQPRYRALEPCHPGFQACRRAFQPYRRAFQPCPRSFCRPFPRPQNTDSSKYRTWAVI